ncbi:MAG TPA: hypothetical protein VM166_07325 [Gemmatimonadaceae bacterium]|nr:hypothetical protein [Gemmatimonadaceae bacterium]
MRAATPYHQPPLISDRNTSRTLPRDRFRTVLAVLIVLLTLGGWVYALMRPEYRAALPAQGQLWWIEQLVSIALMIAALGVVFQRRAFVAAAFWLSAYSLVFDIVRWYFELSEVRVPVPLTVILYALFMWRIWRVGRSAEADAEAPPTV